MWIKILCGIIVVLLVLIAVKYADNKNRKLRVITLLDMEWGSYTREDYSDQIWKNISYYYNNNNNEYSIDDITWNDLDMDDIYMIMNHTRTSPGEEMFYNILRCPILNNDELLEREKIISGIQGNISGARELEYALYEIGKNDKVSVFKYLSETDSLVHLSIFPHIMGIMAIIGTILGLFFVSPSLFILLFCALIGVNCYFYFSSKAKINKNIVIFKFIISLLNGCKNFENIDMPECNEYLSKIKELEGKFKKFKRFSFLVSCGNSMSGNIFDAVFDYVRMIFHVDIIKTIIMTDEIEKYKKELIELNEIIGFLDSMMSIASFRSGECEYVVPKLNDGIDKKHILAEEIYHPLISDPVKNSFETDRDVLLTGSNASGKSTFLKTVALNVIFAETIHTVFAKEFVSPFFRIYSSMALRDNIKSSESYFIVEIKSIKRIFDAISENEHPVLCFIDEILRGTNTDERIAASSVLLESLSKDNALCFGATHDIELTYDLEKMYENYHFEEKFCDDDIMFDYILRKGRSNTRNALKLLEKIGFDKNIIEAAKRKVNE